MLIRRAAAPGTRGISGTNEGRALVPRVQKHATMRTASIVTALVLAASAAHAAKPATIRVRKDRAAAWNNNVAMRSRTPIGFNHQGGPNENAENSMAGFKRAQRTASIRKVPMAGVPDTDLHATADGELVAHHDKVTGRHSMPAGRVLANETFAELGDVHMVAPDGSQHPLIRFDDLVREFPEGPISVEVKTIEAARVLVTKLRANPALTRRLLVGGFSDEAVKLIRAEVPEAITFMSTKEGLKFYALASIPGIRRLPWRVQGDIAAFPHTLSEFSEQLGPGGKYSWVPRFIQRADLARPAVVKTAHRKGLKYMVWTVDEPDAMHTLLDKGADGIWSDSPTLMTDVQAERNAR